MVLCGLLAAPQFSSAQDLTPEQGARILQRFPQADRDGDGKLSSDEIEPLRELIEKAREKRKARTKQTAAKPKGPAQTANDNPQPDEAKTKKKGQAHLILRHFFGRPRGRSAD